MPYNTTEGRAIRHGQQPENPMSKESFDKPSDVADGALIECNLVADADRLQFLPAAFGPRAMAMLRGEGLVYDWMGRLCPQYEGGYWSFFWLTNGGFYMALAAHDRFRLISPGNGFEGELSADGAGIVATLFALCQLAAENEDNDFGELMAKRYHQLREFVGQHPEAALIYRAID